MTEMNLDKRTTARLRRWRRLSRAVSGSLGAAAIGGALFLGATGPLVSPVQPPAAAAVVAPAPAVVNDPVDDGPGPTRQDHGRPGNRPGDPDQGRHR